jgi:hypothetical protein
MLEKRIFLTDLILRANKDKLLPSNARDFKTFLRDIKFQNILKIIEIMNIETKNTMNFKQL